MEDSLMWNLIGKISSSPIWFKYRCPPFFMINYFPSALQVWTFLEKYSFIRTLSEQRVSNRIQFCLLAYFIESASVQSYGWLEESMHQYDLPQNKFNQYNLDCGSCNM